MSFTNPKPFGYLTGDLIDESEINYWCAVLPDCLDGAGGGSYTLSAPLIIGGDAVEIATLIATDLTVTGSAAFTTAQFTGGVTIGDAGADTLTVNSATSFTGDVTIGNAGSDVLTVTSGTTFQNDITLGLSSAFTATLVGVLAPSGSGRVLQSGVNVSSASQSVSGLQYRYIVITYGTTTTTTITGSFVNGDMVRIYNGSGVSQNIAGAPLAATLASGVSISRLLISGTWTTVGD